jgi:multiple antibiotic resistance protein
MTNSYIKTIFSSLITLFPVINPIGTSFILNPFFSGLPRNDQKKIAKTIAIYAFFLCAVTLLIGQYILELFGVSIPVVQLAGGIMISKIGWDLTKDDTPSKEVDLGSPSSFEHLKNKLFYPITFPITTGAGTISVLLTLAAHNKGTTYVHSLINLSAVLIAVVAMCILIYVFYSNTTHIIQHWSTTERNIVNKITAFLIFAYGLEIASDGIFNIIKTFNH